MGWFSSKMRDVPEVGSEDVAEEEKVDSEEDSLEDDIILKTSGKKSRKKSKGNDNSSDLFELKAEKLETQIDSIKEYMKGYSERFSTINQQIGEVRSSSLSNEKNIAKISVEASKAIDLVADVKPNKLRIDFQKLDLKISSVDEKGIMQKETLADVLSEFEEFKRKSKIFVGTEGLLKLNKGIQKDLIQVQKLASSVKLNADKCQNIFVEVNHGFAEAEKVKEMSATLERKYIELSDKFEKNKIAFDELSTKKETENTKVVFELKIKEILKMCKKYDESLEYNKALDKMLQKISILAQNNESKLKKVSATESEKGYVSNEEFESLLDVVDKLSLEVSSLKKEPKIKSGDINVKKMAVSNKKVVTKKPIKKAVNVASKKITKKKVVTKKPIKKAVKIVSKKLSKKKVVSKKSAKKLKK